MSTGAQRFQCKAGFWHPPGEECGHNIAPQGQSTPAPQPVYKVPRNHDTVVINDAGRVIRSYKSGGFYSDEETAKRREANRLLYEPHREPPPNMKRALARQQEPVEDEFFG